MIGLALTLLEWAATGLAAIAVASAVQIWSWEPALVGLAAMAVAALSRLITVRRATGLYRDDALRRLGVRWAGPSANDDGRRL